MIKLIVFDLDGVLLDTKSNMQLSWKAVQDKFNIGYINFNEYLYQYHFHLSMILTHHADLFE